MGGREKALFPRKGGPRDLRSGGGMRRIFGGGGEKRGGERRSRRKREVPLHQRSWTSEKDGSSHEGKRGSVHFSENKRGRGDRCCLRRGSMRLSV